MPDVATPTEVATLPLGQWVLDANGTARCLVDTHVGWPQRMWMSQGGRGYTGIEHIPYPLQLMELNEECPHSWGAQECGHCRRCGQVIAEATRLELHGFAVAAAPVGEEQTA